MLLNCGVGEDSWESLGLQRRSNQSILKEISPGCSLEELTPVLWPPHAKSWLIGKDSDAGKDWGQEEKGTTEDEMVGWHHRLNGHGFGWTPGVGDRQGGLAYCGSWVAKSWTWLSDWTELNIIFKGHLILDFPRGPVIENPPCNTGDTGSFPGGETEIPHAVGPACCNEDRAQSNNTANNKTKISSTKYF